MANTKLAEKRELLLLIRDNYPILSGKFSSTLNFEDKRNAWQKIFDICVSKNHQWTAGRDSKWLASSKWPSIVKEFKVFYHFS